MLRTRLNMLAPDPQRYQAGFQGDTLAPVCHDLWEVVNTALVGGQRLTDPRLLPGAPISQFECAAGAPCDRTPVLNDEIRDQLPAKLALEVRHGAECGIC